jgi:type IV pilus assembly protein PilM
MSPFPSKRDKSIVGVDVEAGSIAATEVRANGSVEVIGQGVMPLEPGIFREGEVADAEALGEALKELFSTYKLSRSVRFGVANQRIAVRTLSLPAIEDADELANAIRFQAQDHIPMPLEQAVLDWEVIGHTTGPNGERQLDVVVVAGRRDMLSAVVAAMRHAGLKPEGIDLSAFGMIRALTGAGNGAVAAPAPIAAGTSYEDRYGASAQGAGAAAAEGATAEAAGVPEDPAAAPPAPATLYCNLGDVLNLAVAQGPHCRFTRISPFGVEGMAQKLAERRQLTLEHSRQWLVHVGLAAPVEQVEGDPEVIAATRETLADGVAKLVDELRLSLEYYGTQDGSVPVENVIACGPGTTIPGLVERLQETVGYPFAIGRPAALSSLEDAAAARLTLSYGLALED